MNTKDRPSSYIDYHPRNDLGLAHAFASWLLAFVAEDPEEFEHLTESFRWENPPVFNEMFNVFACILDMDRADLFHFYASRGNVSSAYRDIYLLTGFVTEETCPEARADLMSMHAAVEKVGNQAQADACLLKLLNSRELRIIMGDAQTKLRKFLEASSPKQEALTYLYA